MSDLSATSYDGTLERTADGGVIRFERQLAYPIRDVWDAITNPARLAEWWLPFDAHITVDLREGGQMVMTAAGDEPMTITCTILRVEPPMLLEHTHVDPGSLHALGARAGRHRVRAAPEPLRHRRRRGDRQLLRRRLAHLAGSARTVPRRSPDSLGLGCLRGRSSAVRQRWPRTGGDRSLSRRGSSAGVSGAMKRTGRQNRWDASRHRPSPRLGRGRDGLGGPRGRGPSEDRADRTRCAGRTGPPCGRPTPPPPCGRTSRRRCPRRAGGERASIGGSHSLSGPG